MDDDLGSAFADLVDGRREALGVLYDALASDLFGLALWRTGNRDDAADVVQEVFVRLARTSASLCDVRDPRAYVLQIGRRIAIDLVRARPPLDSIESHPVLEAGSDSVETRLHAKVMAGRMTELPLDQREVVYLRHFLGLSFKEIGNVSGVPTFTAASRYRLALRRLRRLMGVES